MFRLKHASVSDRVIRYRDQQVVTPGMATMLRQLILGAGPGNDAALAAVAAPLRKIRRCSAMRQLTGTRRSLAQPRQPAGA